MMEEAVDLRGDEAFLVCDRKIPARQFVKDIDKYVAGQDKCRAYFCVVQATKEDCPDSFIKRLMLIDLREMIATRWNDSPTPKDILVEWACHAKDDTEQMCDMLIENILASIGCRAQFGNDSTSLRTNFYARIRSINRVCIIRHSVEAKEWHSGMNGLLQRYAALLASSPPDSPLFLVFFTVQLAPANVLTRMLGWKRVPRVAKRIRQVLEHATKTYPTLRYQVLDPLEEVAEQDVLVTLNRIYGPLLTCDIKELCGPLFARRRKVPMHEIEQRFLAKRNRQSARPLSMGRHLTGDQYQQLQTALLRAFDRGSLTIFVRTQMDESLDTIAGGKNDSEVVCSLIDWAEQKGCTRDLVCKAHQYIPGNPYLSDFARAYCGSGE